MAYLLIAVAIILRLVPHIPNVAPVAAIALFSGVYLGRKQALTIPLVAMFLSDLFIGFYTWQIMVAVYASFALTALIGFWVRERKSIPTVIGGGLAGSLAFFITTNFAVWAFGNMYPKTVSGIMSCYIAAIPFFRNSLLGDLFYVGILFGTYETVRVWREKRVFAKSRA